MKSKILCIRFCFSIICVVGAILMVGYWIYKFLVEDRDLGVVDYELIEKASVDYPIPSICFTNPFLTNKLKEYDPNITNTKYSNYLKGETSLDYPEAIDYYNSTIDIKDYLGAVQVKLSNESKLRNIKTGTWNKDIFNGFVNNGHFVKCFGLGLEKEKYPSLQQVTYHILTLKLLKDLNKNKQRILLNIHYSGQYLLQPNPNSNDQIVYGINGHTLIYIKSIEFIKRRKNRNHDCLLDGKHYDDAVLHKHIKNHGCSATYHRTIEGIPVCYNQTIVKQYYYYLNMARKKYHSKACQRLSYLNYEIQNVGKGINWRLIITYPEEVKIIQQYKEVDGHALIGNIGGYIGLFLGTNHIFLWSKYEIILRMKLSIVSTKA